MNGGVLPAEQAYDPLAGDTLWGLFAGNLSGVALALFPVVLAFIPCCLFIVNIPRSRLFQILLGVIPVYVGLLIFLTGIDYGFAFAGKYIGEVFLDPARPEYFEWILLVICFLLGMAITLSEPAVTVLGDQLEELTNGHIKKFTIRGTLAIGIGFAAVLSVIKILSNLNILWFLGPLYLVAMLLMKFTSTMFVALAFDSGGVTGGALTSAFLTPLTLGIAQMVAERTSENVSILNNGLGIIAFISVTPLIAVQVLGIIYQLKANVIQKAAEEEELSRLEQFLATNNGIASAIEKKKEAEENGV
jgi:MFS family permease